VGWYSAAVLVATAHSLVALQALPPPRDGDIRVLYWELQKETEVWLTLEPKSPEGKPLPTAMNLTFTLRFPGMRPPTPPSRIEVRANAGLTAMPRPVLWLVLGDGQKIDLTPPGTVGLTSGAASDYIPAWMPVETLRQVAEADRVSGNALGMEFELTPSQREALRAFLSRVVSDNPGQFPKRESALNWPLRSRARRDMARQPRDSAASNHRTRRPVQFPAACHAVRDTPRGVKFG
jgi:hypothetical protein